MSRTLVLRLWLVLCSLSVGVPQVGAAGDSMVRVEAGKFTLHGREYRFVGANFWYAAILASEGQGGDRPRLERELDRLQALGVRNLRVLAGGDGPEGDPARIRPVLQQAPGVYNDTILRGLDYLLHTLERRGMQVVLYLNNAWNWSGGYASYLHWAGVEQGRTDDLTGAGELSRGDEWTQYQRHHSQFLRNDSARALALRHTRHLVSRVSSLTGRPYSQSPAIMAWEVANEPRAFARDSLTKACFLDYIREQAVLIKSLDPNHLVTTGSEGKYGCEVDLDLFRRIHALPQVDYLCIHVWPYNWAWLGRYLPDTPQAIAANGPASTQTHLEQAIRNTARYVREHAAVARELQKPMVLEEFGYPRDGYALSPASGTTARDTYYRSVFALLRQEPTLAGCNFWGWGGEAVAPTPRWHPGQPYTADPAQEEQGLNSVFLTDTTTLEAIREGASGL